MTATETLECVQTVDPHADDDRRAMGLGDGLVERMPADAIAVHADLLSAEAAILSVTCGDPSEPFARRWAAGTIAGLRGDPRIRPTDPEMIDVPAGCCLIGWPPERVPEVVAAWSRVGVRELWIRKECPRHAVDIPAFRIMRYPVTNAEYREFLRDSRSTALPTSWKFGTYPIHLSNHPVWTVRATDADAYAAWLSARTGREFRLPTEDQWEYAASGGDGRQFPWGEEFLPDRANTVEAGPVNTTPVGIYPAGASPFGVDDLAGNVEEYVAGDYRPYAGGEKIVDDLGGSEQAYRVVRGGSFTRFGDLARCARRHGWFDRRMYAIGFRLVESS